MDKLLVENTTITPALEHELEEEAIKSVCGREKTRKSGYEVMNGPIFRKKDMLIISAVEPSPRASNENEELKSKIDDLQNKLREEKEQNQEKLNRLQEYLATKFDDFDSTMVSSTSNEGSGDQRNENSNGIPGQGR